MRMQRIGPSNLAGRRATVQCMAVSLSNKRVAVVGASRGIGLEFVRQLLAKGNSVIGTAREPAKADKLQKLATDRLNIHYVDTSDSSSIKDFASGLARDGVKLDAVFNIAGVAGWSDLESVTSEQLLRLFTVNAVGPILVVQSLLKEGVLQDQALVANMTSKMGCMGDNTSGGSYAYRCSKAALNAACKSMSIDLKDRGMTVVTLHPGWVRTEMTNQSGLIDVDQSVSGLLSLLETRNDLNGRIFDYKHEELPF